MTELKENILQFVLGGKSIFTVVDGSNHYTYKIQRKKTDDNSKIFWCSAIRAGKVMYFGYIKISGNRLKYKHNTKNGIGFSDSSTRIFQTLISTRGAGMTIYHMGRCGCCGKMLTDPDSISRGFGPDCWKKIKPFVSGGKK